MQFVGVFSVRAMTGKGRLIPRIALAGTIGNVLGLVQQGGRQGSVGVTLQVDHVVGVFTGVAMDKQPGSAWTSLLALLCIARKPIAPGRVTDRKIEPITKPNT
jgi:hypothetical protein